MRTTFSAPDFAYLHDEWHLSPGVDTGEFVFFSGVTGCHPDDITVAAEPETQFREAFQFLGNTLAAGELRYEDILEMTTYHVELRKHLDVFTRVKDEFIKPPYPAWSAIGATELITPGTLVEIRVICRRSSNST